MLVILATLEAEIRRITESSPGKTFAKPHLNGKSWAWWCAYVISATMGNINKRITEQVSAA
jgi:hypothetical protein